MKKARKNYISKSVKTIIDFCICNLVLLLCFIWMMFMTQPATMANTYSLNTTIVDLYTRKIPSRADMVYFITQDGDFKINWTNGDKYIDSFVKAVSSEQHICLVILDNSYTFNIIGPEIKEIVEIRSDNQIYHSINDYNKWQKDNRIAGICSFVLFFLIFNSYFAIVFFVNYNIKKPFKRRKKKNQRSVSVKTSSGKSKKGNKK